jgi:GTPase SAR1 family protein
MCSFEKSEGRVSLLQHVLQVLVGHLAGLETQIPHDLVLCQELLGGRQADVNVFRPHLLNEHPELGRQVQIGSNRPRRLHYALTITFSIWDLGRQHKFVNMLPLICNDAVAILFMFNLSRKSMLNLVKEWHCQARGFNKVCFPSHLILAMELFLTF